MALPEDFLKIKIDPDEALKTLGIIWQSELDYLKFDLNVKENDDPFTYEEDNPVLNSATLLPPRTHF